MFAIVQYNIDRCQDGTHSFVIKKITSDLELAKKIAFKYSKERMLCNLNPENRILKISDNFDNEIWLGHKSYGHYRLAKIDSEKKLSLSPIVFSVIAIPPIDNTIVDDIDMNLLLHNDDYKNDDGDGDEDLYTLYTRI